MDIIHFDAHLDLVDENHLQGKYSQSSEIPARSSSSASIPSTWCRSGFGGFNYPWYYDCLKNLGVKQCTAWNVQEGDPCQIAAETLA